MPAAVVPAPRRRHIAPTAADMSAGGECDDEHDNNMTPDKFLLFALTDDDVLLLAWPTRADGCGDTMPNTRSPIPSSSRARPP